LEGIAFSLKSVLERIESLVGPQRQITVSARETSDHRWLALRAGVYGRPMALQKTSEPTALGAMIVAAVGVGMYEGLSEAARRVTGSQRVIEPNADLTADYARLYRLYRRATETMLPLMRQWMVGH
jgi:sugar (pentulose or hexulose) kinase